MTIKVLFFAGLREQLGIDKTEIDSRGIKNAVAVWHAVNGDMAMPTNTLVAINHEFAKLDQAVKAGDEVAFFPPVTGG